MKVAFLSGNREHLPDPVIPLGLLYIHANTPAHYPTEFWDLCFEQDPWTYLDEKLAFNPDVIAIGMRNIQNADYTDTSGTMAWYQSLTSYLKKNSKAKVVLGGSGFSVTPQSLMQQIRPDFGLSGEGEESFPKLLKALEEQTPLVEVPGLLYWEDEALKTVPRATQFVDLSAIRHPSRNVVDARYYQKTGIESVQSKRGCPLHCTYCTYPVIEGKNRRSRDPASVADEMTALANHEPKPNHFFITDSVFNLPPSHAKAICRELIQRGFKTPWTSYINPIQFDLELAQLMVEAGAIGMEVGSDSGCDEILAKLKKGFTAKQISSMSATCRQVGLKDCHTFILGTPGETLDHVQRSLDFIVELDPFAAILMIWTDDEETVQQSESLASREFKEAILEKMQALLPTQPRWVVPPLGVNFDVPFFQRLRSFGLKGPLWQHLHLSRPAKRMPLENPSLQAHS